MTAMPARGAHGLPCRGSAPRLPRTGCRAAATSETAVPDENEQTLIEMSALPATARERTSAPLARARAAGRLLQVASRED